MRIELTPEHQEVLERAAKSGMSPEEVLQQAFAVIHEQFQNEEWMLAERESITAQIAEGFHQAESAELIEPEDAARLLQERRAKRQVA